MKLIVGLSNPGRKYEGTRHNVGGLVIAELARRHASGKPKERFQGQLIEANIHGEKALLLTPFTYMNLSGQCVQPALAFYKLTAEDLLVVCDDFNLDLAKLRFRARGSSGGQKGLADIIRRLGSEEFARLRLGIGRPPEQWDPADYVLGRFARSEQPLVDEAVQQAADGIADWVGRGIDYCMCHYN